MGHVGPHLSEDRKCLWVMIHGGLHFLVDTITHWLPCSDGSTIGLGFPYQGRIAYHIVAGLRLEA